LLLAIATEEVRVFFWLEEERRAGSAVAGEGLLPMPGQRVLFMGRIKRSKLGEKIGNEASHLILWMKDEKQGAKKSFYLAAFRMPRERSTRSFSKCRLKHWCKRVIMIRANFREKYITPKLGGMC